jgi:hypothetical protein
LPDVEAEGEASAGQGADFQEGSAVHGFSLNC